MKETILVIILCTQTGCVTFPERHIKKPNSKTIITLIDAKQPCMDLIVTGNNSAIIKPCKE